MLIWGALPAQGANRYPSVRLVPWDLLQKKSKSLQQSYIANVRFTVLLLEEELMGNSTFADDKLFQSDTLKNQFVWNLFLQKALAANTCLIGGLEQPRIGNRCSTRNNSCELDSSNDNFKCGQIFGSVCIPRTPPESISQRCFRESNKSDTKLSQSDYEKFQSDINSIYDKFCKHKDYTAPCIHFGRRLTEYKKGTEEVPSEGETPRHKEKVSREPIVTQREAARLYEIARTYAGKLDTKSTPKTSSDEAPQQEVAPTAPENLKDPLSDEKPAEATNKIDCTVDNEKLLQLRNQKKACMQLLSLDFDRLYKTLAMDMNENPIKFMPIKTNAPNLKEELTNQAFETLTLMMSAKSNQLSSVSSQTFQDSQCKADLRVFLSGNSDKTVTAKSDTDSPLQIDLPEIPKSKSITMPNQKLILTRINEFGRRAKLPCLTNRLNAIPYRAKPVSQGHD